VVKPQRALWVIKSRGADPPSDLRRSDKEVNIFVPVSSEELHQQRRIPGRGVALAAPLGLITSLL
jgi:hypothetical protein